MIKKRSFDAFILTNVNKKYKYKSTKANVELHVPFHFIVKFPVKRGNSVANIIGMHNSELRGNHV